MIFFRASSACSLKQVIHLLQMLLAKHPAMKGVVVREVQQYLHRPGLQPKAVYAGVIFLNQVSARQRASVQSTARVCSKYRRWSFVRDPCPRSSGASVFTVRLVFFHFTRVRL